jgi:hypothetical protein
MNRNVDDFISVLILNELIEFDQDEINRLRETKDAKAVEAAIHLKSMERETDPAEPYINYDDEEG